MRLGNLSGTRIMSTLCQAENKGIACCGNIKMKNYPL